MGQFIVVPALMHNLNMVFRLCGNCVWCRDNDNESYPGWNEALSAMLELVAVVFSVIAPEINHVAGVNVLGKFTEWQWPQKLKGKRLFDSVGCENSSCSLRCGF